jgi:hypothetical protein
MKMKICSLLILCAAHFVTSCSKDGSNGKTALTRSTKEAGGANCKYGGTKFETGIDANNNGILDNNEVTATQTTYVCDGAGATYSSWFDVNVKDTSRLPEEYNYFYKQFLPAAAVTADIVKNGLVMMYYKTRDGVIVPVHDHYIIDSTGGANGYLFGFRAGFVYKEKYLSFLSDQYPKEMNDNGSAVRYILIPGMVQGRSIADVKKMPYSEIAKLYNIKD